MSAETSTEGTSAPAGPLNTLKHRPSSVDIRSALSSTPTTDSPMSAEPTLAAPAPVQLAPTTTQDETETVDVSGEPPVEKDLAESSVLGGGPVLSVEFLLLSGKRLKLELGHDAKVAEVREYVWKHWPEDWRGQEDLPPSADSLRLLYLGKFLDDKSTLGSYGLKPGQTTIIHLHVRALQISSYDEDNLKSQDRSSGCSCCVIS